MTNRVLLSSAASSATAAKPCARLRESTSTFCARTVATTRATLPHYYGNEIPSRRNS